MTNKKEISEKNIIGFKGNFITGFTWIYEGEEIKVKKDESEIEMPKHDDYQNEFRRKNKSIKLK